MEIETTLLDGRDAIVADAFRALSAAGRYATLPHEELTKRLNELTGCLFEAVTKRDVAPNGDIASALAVVTTILGAGKDALAWRYVGLAAEHHAPTIDLASLLSGTAA
ncbi:MAG: hypothetical protein H0X39_10635 [Actinobacteria bacterium]|nr:hypothetical protein [Actinomycetota bacterium]